MIWKVNHATSTKDYAMLPETLSRVIAGSLQLCVEHLRLEGDQIKEQINAFDKCDTVRDFINLLFLVFFCIG